MNRGEIREFIPQFVALLRENGLEWVVRQVAQSLVDDDVAMLSDGDISRILQQADNPSEVLRALLDAVEILVVETAEMEREIYEFFVDDNIAEVNSNNLARQAILNGEDVIAPSQLFSQSRIAMAANMKNIIDRLREQVQ